MSHTKIRLRYSTLRNYAIIVITNTNELSIADNTVYR